MGQGLKLGKRTRKEKHNTKLWLVLGGNYGNHSSRCSFLYKMPLRFNTEGSYQQWHVVRWELQMWKL